MGRIELRLALIAALVAFACSEDRPRARVEGTTARQPERARETTAQHGEEMPHAHAHGEPVVPDAPLPDETSSASPHHTSEPAAPTVPMTDEIGVDAMVRRNHERMRAMREAPVHVIAERDPIEAGRRLCEAVVPQRPAATPVLIKPNLSGFDMMRERIDNGVELRTTGVDFLRGIVRCLRARGHTQITLTDAWSRAEQRIRFLRETGIDRLVAEEGVRFVGLWEDRGESGSESPMVEAPFPRARHLRNDLLIPRLLARHLTNGLYLTVPRLKMHRYAVTSLAIKNAMGVVVMRGAEEPGSRSDRMHAEIGPWLTRWRAEHVDDRAAYVRSLELFAERLSDVLEVELPDATLIDGVPPVAGDGFRVIEPFDDGVAIGSVNPILAEAVATEWMGYLDNADLEREIRHRTSPILEEAARRFYGNTEILRNVQVVGDDAFRARRRVAHYVGFSGFEIGGAPQPMGALPWMLRALPARRIASEPVLDGNLNDAVWSGITPIAIAHDWQGRRAGPETLARLAWTPDALFFAFDCAYEALNVAEDAARGEVDDLYRRDVVEIFIDESPRSRGTYREIEVDPLGRFLDIAVDLSHRPRGDTEWSSGITTGASIDREARRFRIEARVPAEAFGGQRLAPSEWRINLYRIAGVSPRTFMAQFPTYSERANFHVPDRFGWVRLIDARQ